MMPALLETHNVLDGIGQTDLKGLVRHLLVGQKLLFVKPTYLVEMTLHFGDLVEKKAPRGITLRGGTTKLNPLASWVSVQTSSGGVAWKFPSKPGSTRPKVAEIEKLFFEAGVPIVEEADIEAADGGYALRLRFSNGFAVTVLPNTEEDETEQEAEAHPLPDWELLVPNHRILVVGPGLKWEYRRSDIPQGQ